MDNWVPAKIARLKTKDGLYELHPSMLNVPISVDPVPFVGVVQHYRRRSWFIRWLVKDDVLLVRRHLLHVESGGAYPAELIEFLR